MFGDMTFNRYGGTGPVAPKVEAVEDPEARSAEDQDPTLAKLNQLFPEREIEQIDPLTADPTVAKLHQLLDRRGSEEFTTVEPLNAGGTTLPFPG